MNRGPYHPVSNEDGRRLALAVEEGRDWKQLADILGIKRKTAKTIVDTYVQTGRIEKLPSAGGRPKQLQEQQIESIIEFLEANPSATLQMMRNHLMQLGNEGQLPHVSTISRALDKQLVTLKLARQITFDWNDPVVKAARCEYAQWMMNEGHDRNQIFLDEFGLNLWTARTQGWAYRGQPAVRTVCGQRGQNLTLCLAISPQWGLVHYALVEGGFRAQNFADFLVELDVLVEAEWVAIFDGARAHLQVPGLSPQHSTYQLPPYSPYLNPTERAGSSLKASVKRALSVPAIQHELSNRQAAAAANLTLHAWRMHILKREVEAALHVITQEKCQQWTNHTVGYYGRCLDYEDILN